MYPFKWLFLFFSLLFVLYVSAPDYIGVNQTARYDLTKSIVLDHSFSIDKYVSNTGDWAKKDDHYYSNKSPGGSFIGVPFYWMIVKAEQLIGLDPQEKNIDSKNLGLVDIFVTTLPSIALSILMLVYLLAKSEGNLRQSWMIVYAYAVGTLAFPYSTTWWGHQTGAAFLFFAYYCMVQSRTPWWAGFFLGWAVLVEHSLALTIPAFAAFYFFSKSETLRSRIRFAIGGALPLLALLFYNKACFGGYLTTAFKYSNPIFIEPGRFLGVFGWPVSEAIFSTTFSRQRGLFLMSPVLLLSFLGFYRWTKSWEQRHEAFVCLWIIFSVFLFGITFFGWRGGSCAGPRYLTPLVPFLAVALVYVRPNPIFYLALFFSVFHHTSIVAVDLMPDMECNLMKDKIYLELFRNFKNHLSFLWMAPLAGVLFAIVHFSTKKNKSTEITSSFGI